MDVAAYFKKLLYRERAVYVPGLGTFLTRKSAGIYNRKQQRFYPPKNSIDFVAEEKEDTMLENYISRQKNISPAAARYFIEKFAEQLQSAAQTKNIPVKEVLFPSEAEAVTTSPNAVPAFNMENFGLPPVNIPFKKKIPEPAKKEFVPEPNQVQDIYQEIPNDLDDNETMPKRSTGFWASVLLLLALGLLGCYALYLYDPDLFSRFSENKPAAIVTKRTVVNSVNTNPTVKAAPEKDTSLTKAVMDTPAKQSAATVKTMPPASKPVVKDSVVLEAAATDPDLVAKSPYEIIGASFKTLNGAKAFLNQLKAKGMHRARILSNTAGKQKLITFGSFTDKETAQAALEKIHARDPQSEAYIQHYIIK